MARTAKPKFKVLDQRIVAGQQSVTMKVTTEFNGHKVLFTLVNDAYKSQCAAVAKVWRPDHLDWSVVVRMVPEDLQMKEGAIYKPAKSGVNEVTFVKDYMELQRLTAQILA